MLFKLVSRKGMEGGPEKTRPILSRAGKFPDLLLQHVSEPLRTLQEPIWKRPGWLVGLWNGRRRVGSHGKLLRSILGHFREVQQVSHR